MEAAESLKSSESHPMNGGDGLYSYSKNSSYQRGVTDTAKELVKESIVNKFNIKNLFTNTIRIVDLGCSVGPNTFYVMQNIGEAIKLKYQLEGLNSTLPEFEVFFNDHTSNDFNSLFRSLPFDRQYYAAGVPGSFYERLFPVASLHFAYSSYALHWLSKVPKEVTDKSSPAWNKGRIYYLNAVDEVVQAYSAQYAKDMECFLHARAQEIVCGGLLVFIIQALPNGTPFSQSMVKMTFDLLESCLKDMAEKGMISEEKLDSFNLPMYHVYPQELEAIIEQNGCFSIEQMESLPHVDNTNKPDAQFVTMTFRAVFEGLIKEHFGTEILDELFDSYYKKLEANFPIFETRKSTNLFILLKRKAN